MERDYTYLLRLLIFPSKNQGLGTGSRHHAAALGLRAVRRSIPQKTPSVFFLVLPRGIEPRSQASEACVLSIELRERIGMV